MTKNPGQKPGQESGQKSGQKSGVGLITRGEGYQFEWIFVIFVQNLAVYTARFLLCGIFMII